MRRTLTSVGLLAVLQFAIAGCCGTGLPPESSTTAYGDLERANADLQARNKSLEDSLRAKDAEIARLQSDLTVKDATIANLSNQLSARPVAAAPQSSEPTGFESAGEVTRHGNAVSVAISSDLLFDSGKATLKEKRRIGTVASVIQSKYPGYKVKVRGHTDNDPIRRSGWKDNWDLGFNRARAVALQLMADGVPEGVIEMDSLSNTEPSGKGKARDRRVEVEVSPPGEGR